MTTTTLLMALAKAALARLSVCKQQGDLLEIRTPCRVPKCTLTYDKGLAGFNTVYHSEVRTSWQWQEPTQSLEERLKPLPEYAHCIQHIIDSRAIDRAHVEDLLCRFLHSLSDEDHSPLSEDSLLEKIVMFQRDLDAAPVMWHLSIWLKGLWLEAESYTVTPLMHLRRPMGEDLERRIVLGLWDGRNWPDAIVTIQLMAADFMEVDTEVDTLLNVFRLFRLGSVWTHSYEHTPHSFRHMWSISGSQEYFGTLYHYGMTAADLSFFIKFLNVVKPLVLKHVGSNHASTPTLLGIAAQRYREAVLHVGPMESRITSAITCLESLFLKGAERSELSHRLGQRSAALLRFWGFDPVKVYHDVIRAYDIRSTYIHGALVSKEQLANADELCKRIIEYARVSLVAFVQLADQIDKDRLISKLETTMLLHSSAEKLDALLRPVIMPLDSVK